MAVSPLARCGFEQLFVLLVAFVFLLYAGTDSFQLFEHHKIPKVDETEMLCNQNCMKESCLLVL